MAQMKPKVSDTEDDLLELQKKFLSSGERPSASLAGEKRKIQQSTGIVKDIVTLKEGEPRTKKSKFRERRERLARKHEPELHMDPHKAMDSQDTHITKVLMDIQDHGLLPAAPHAITTGHTKHGFPLVPTLDFDLLTLTPPDAGTDKKKPKKKTKSLFAQMFEKKGPGFFGVESGGPEGKVSVPYGGRDYVEPVSIGGEIGEQSRDMECQPVCKEGAESDVESLGGKLLKEGYSSTAATTWDRFRSTLISGEGLASTGESEDTVRSDISKIHQENVARLAGLSEAEVLQEKEQIEKALGPELVAFVKKSRQKQPMNQGADMEVTPAGAGELTPSLVPPDGWLHMDVVEKEKLEWMTELPPMSANPKLDKMESRFSLEGLVIPRSVDIPSHLGLHHHGDEPQAAGYTLGELIPLCRSSVLQQRVLSLQMLSRIICRARQREYQEVVEESVIERLCEAEVPLLLRYAVCEATEPVVIAAVQAIHALLVTTTDQVLLQEYGLCYSGHRLPALRGRGKPVLKGGEEEEEETERDIFQRDIIEGFLKMNLLLRVRYLLEVFLVQGPPNALIQLLEILTRIARHSTGAASQILNCPRLMQVIFEQYLPLAWSRDEGEEKEKESSQVGGRPQVAAVNLIRAMCVAGRHITAQLISKYNLLSVITCYAVLHPSEQNLPTSEAYLLSVASLGTWQVLMSYGFGDEAFRDTLPVYIKQLHQLTTVTALSSSLESKRISALLGLVESAICLAAVTPDQLTLAGEGHRKIPAPCVEWVHVAALMAPLLHMLVTWTRENVGHTPDQDVLLVMGALLNVVATYYNKLKHRVRGESPVVALEQIETLMTNVVKILPTSAFFSTVLDVMREGHHLDSSQSVDASPPILPAHFTPPVPPHRAVYGQTSSTGPDLQPHAIFARCTNVLVGMARLCFACVQLHKGVVDGVAWMFTDTTYRQCLAVAGKGELSSYLRAEIAHCTIQLFLTWVEAHVGLAVEKEMLQFFHHLSFELFISLPQGADHLAYNLLSSVLFHPLFYSAASKGGVFETTTPKNVYLKTLRLQKGLSCPLHCESHLLNGGGALVPCDWMFSPIMLECNKILQLKKDGSAIDVSSIKEMLSYLLLLEQCYSYVLSHLSLATKLSRLMCLFLLGDLFLEDPIRTVLLELTRLYCQPETLSSLDLIRPIPGLQSFSNLYTSFLEHFCSVSYGDHLFGCFVLIPLQQKMPVFFRRLVWEEHPQVMRILSVPLEKLPMDVEPFLYPIETDDALIERYLFSLVTDIVRKRWSPVLYHIAVHHVHSFIFTESETASPLNPLQKKLLSSIMCIKDEVVRQDLLGKHHAADFQE